MQRSASVPGPLLPRRGRPPRGGARIQSESWSGGPGSWAGAGPRLPGTAGTEDDARRCERGTTPRVPGRSPENDGEREGGRRGGQRAREREGGMERESERERDPPAGPESAFDPADRPSCGPSSRAGLLARPVARPVRPGGLVGSLVVHHSRGSRGLLSRPESWRERSAPPAAGFGPVRGPRTGPAFGSGGPAVAGAVPASFSRQSIDSTVHRERPS